ncbi:four helix bundle protein [Capnocytophaga genosp. AHN8471]|jgi:30S ribosomal protein S23|uniref:Four helix bundle protein n=1 Tax=Capnocytophaga genosp. AHN8471 TaxID=327574 RepID=A0ABS1YUZ7_9FLAO|nr:MULTISPECIES: four helix bundle protein [Capnocytophaga]EKY18507.1 S23 ribosomal protein [Capnocytophaga sp. oral taxon 326 str. F0382]MBM0650229.1 four helix bundle protein [Capnocytophaga genosp. AHN8471]MBM0653790.1 four helix bundle protein [Capnocytophaga genosp. AHN8471]MBM0656711.1 four helix bundle protein [Capnocytophaga genosp. AHN8471]MBM0660126.1 four helix bundle protein [Capnocytophaga genosp. AHN8471]
MDNRSNQKIEDYKDLIVWQRSMELAEEVYRLVKKLPKEELFALSDQIRRAVISIPSNIAEGYERNSTKEYIHFLSIAKGSKAELETQLLLCTKIHYLNNSDIEKSISLIQEIGKMINSLQKHLILKL